MGLNSFPEGTANLLLGTELEVWRAFQLKYCHTLEQKWATYLNILCGDLHHDQYKWNIARLREMAEKEF